MFAVSGVLITATALPMLLFRFSRDPLWQRQVPPESRSSRVGPDSTKDEHNDTELQASGSPVGTRGSQRPEDTSKSSAIDPSSASAPVIRSDNVTQQTGAHTNEEAKAFAVNIESSAI